MSNTPIDLMLNNVDWKENPTPENKDTLHTTHTGILKVGSFELICHTLSNGERVIDADSLESVFGEDFINQFNKG